MAWVDFTCPKCGTRHTFIVDTDPQTQYAQCFVCESRCFIGDLTPSTEAF